MEYASFDDFKKLDLRIALVEAAERVEGTAKLLKLSLRLGEEKRQIVAGIGDQYAPESLPGKRIIMVYNLQPRNVKGIESQGMMLAGMDKDGRLALVVPDREISDGTQVQ
ncbi:Methionine--tRNA ligase [Candidatus Burarchaeum australiense]|nr:Methionine--tRNA ligase [Candidatus Burarchaeum australiense]